MSWVETVNDLKSRGEFVCPEMPMRSKYFLIRELANKGVRICDRDMSFFLAHKEQYRSETHHIQMNRTEITQMIRQNLPVIVGGMSKI
jgi:hypothetical protein